MTRYAYFERVPLHFESGLWARLFEEPYGDHSGSETGGGAGAEKRSGFYTAPIGVFEFEDSEKLNYTQAESPLGWRVCVTLSNSRFDLHAILMEGPVDLS